jgi:hypothetical protein
MLKALQRFEFDPAAASRDDIFHEREAAIAGSAAVLQNGKPVFTIEQVVQQLTRTGQAWNGLGANPVPNAGLGTITYAFFDVASQVYSSERNEFQPLTAAQRDAARAALAIWGELINVTSTPTTIIIRLMRPCPSGRSRAATSGSTSMRRPIRKSAWGRRDSGRCCTRSPMRSASPIRAITTPPRASI